MEGASAETGLPIEVNVRVGSKAPFCQSVGRFRSTPHKQTCSGSVGMSQRAKSRHFNRCTQQVLTL
jgi:hypothetical protein